MISVQIIITSYFQDGLSARGGTEDGFEEWGYVPLRPGASMFYWLYRTTHADGHKNRPIIFWLQGGPGASGTGLGNFLMFGPLDQDLKPRNFTWIQTANILFVDYPGDSGFSVFDNSSHMPVTTEEITEDLVTFIKTFINEHSEINDNPFYIFVQSYGGKIAAALPYYLLKAIESGNVKCNLKGTAIGNGYVSGPDFLVTWPSMAYQLSLIDDVQKKKAEESAWHTYHRVTGEGNLTDYFLLEIHLSIYNYYNHVFPYNILAINGSSIYQIDIDHFVNGPMREKLKIIPDGKRWKQRIGYTQDDRDHPVWHLLDEVLQTSDIEVIIYSGQLDWICNTAGTLRWMQKLTWGGKKEFDRAERRLLTNPETDAAEMFVKSSGRLKMYWVLNAGHVVPVDVPDVALRMLNRILDGTD